MAALMACWLRSGGGGGGRLAIVESKLIEEDEDEEDEDQANRQMQVLIVAKLNSNEVLTISIPQVENSYQREIYKYQIIHDNFDA